MTKLCYPVKIYFLSFICDHVKVVLTTSFSANGKFYSLEKSGYFIGTYVINRRLRVYLWIQTFKIVKKGSVDK